LSSLSLFSCHDVEVSKCLEEKKKEKERERERKKVHKKESDYLRRNKR
jgi:hypothetical protein